MVLAYADKDTDAMYEMMADTVRYAPPSGGLMVNSREDVPGIVMQLHSPYDSIKRTVWNGHHQVNFQVILNLKQN